MHVRVKVCCIASVEEAKLAVGAGADALGLVARMPSGPGPIDDALIADIAAQVPPAVSSFLLTSETQPEAVTAHVRRCRTNTVQLVDEVPAETHMALRRELPALRVVQVIHVEDESALAQARAVATRVDALLLDSGSPSARTKQLGGTGRAHDWSISARIAAESPIPVFLAGGLHAGNVAAAVAQVRPFGVDVCTGVRTDGKLSSQRLSNFVGALPHS